MPIFIGFCDRDILFSGDPQMAQPSLLEGEKTLLSALIYRSKNQHKSSQTLRKMIQLRRLLRYVVLDERRKEQLIDCCQNLYVICSGDMCMGYFVPLSITVMAVAARIFYLISQIKPKKATAIDEIFGRLA